MTNTDSTESIIIDIESGLPMVEPFPEPETETETEVAIVSEPESELDPQILRLLEAVLFASAEPMNEAMIASRLPEGSDVPRLLTALAEIYAHRGVNLVQAGGNWLFRSSDDLAPQMRVFANPQRKLSRAAIETLAIIAYHQPITRAEMEEIRGVGLSKGTIDILFEQGWIAPRGRRQSPGKPVTWGSTHQFLTDFGIDSLDSLPGMDELKAAGLLDKRPAIQITDGALPVDDEEPLTAEEQERLVEDAAFLARLEDEAMAAEAVADRGATASDDSRSDVFEVARKIDDSVDQNEDFGDRGHKQQG